MKINAITTPISFERNHRILGKKSGKEHVEQYKSSTSGYRGTLGKDAFSDRFVYTMTHAAGQYMKDHKNSITPATIVGGDTRNATKKYAPEISKILQKEGIDVYYPNLIDAKKGEISPIASPVSAVATKEFEIPLTVLLTASHNPWKDGGYNFLVQEGMVAEAEQTDEIAANMADLIEKGELGKTEKHQKGHAIAFDPYEIYSEYIDEKNLVDFENIKNSGIDIYYEDFGGTGKYYFPRLLEDHGIELKGTLSSKTNGPNPVAENMKNLANEVKKSNNPLRIGLATDGDSDRFGAVDENGNFINANDFILLVAYHLIKNKGMNEGTIIKNHSTSEKLEALADYFNKQEGYDISVNSTPVGFKYLGGAMTKLEGTSKEAIVAGEESGGLTIRGHIPEKDGFVAVLTLADLVATEQKPLSEILKDVNALLGKDYVTECKNFEFKTDEGKSDFVNFFEPYASGEKDSIFGYKIDKEKTVAHREHIESMKPNGDGNKIYLENGSSILARKSGTEPKGRCYIDASSPEIFEDIGNQVIEKASEFGGK